MPPREDRDLVVGWEGSLRAAGPPADPSFVPFEDVLAPRVTAARDDLAARAASCRELLSREAFAALERGLLRSLAALCGEVLLSVFSRSSTYAEFARHMAVAGWPALRREFPVLETLMETLVQDWLEANLEFLARLAEDFAAVVVELQPGLSDRHGRGRTVMGLTFTSGRRLVYKPRSLALEKAFFELLHWMNRHGAPLDSKILAVLDRSTHGWMEFAAPQICRDRRCYYTRAGMLHCLLYALYGSDAHMGNLVACGDYPVLVDAECLLQPETASQEDSAVEAMLRPGLLPRPQFGPRGERFDLSGIGGAGGQATGFRVPRWEAVNADGMTLRFVEAEVAPQQNLAGIDCADDFIDGFRCGYRFLSQRRAELLAPDGPLEALFSQRVRVLFRSTREYVEILNRSLQPVYLRSAAARAQALRAWCGESPVSEEEVKALERLDIPRFSAEGGSHRASARIRSLAGPELESLAAAIKALFVSALLDR